MKKLSGGDGRHAHLRAQDGVVFRRVEGKLKRGLRMVLLYTRLCACRGHILTLSIADRRPVPLRADGFGYVRHHHDGYQDCSPVRVQRAYFDIEHSGQKASPFARGWFWIRSTLS